MYAALGVTTILYVLISLGVFGTLTVQEAIGYGETAIAEAARPALGDAGFTMMAIAALLATSSSVNATLYASGGLTAMLAEVGQFPSFFGRSSPLGPHAGMLDHGGDRACRLQSRRPLGDRVRRQRLLAADLPARRCHRVPATRRHRIARHRGLAAIAATAVVLVFFAVDTLPQRSRDVRRDRRDRPPRRRPGRGVEARPPRGVSQPETTQGAELLLRFTRAGHEAGYPTADLEERVLALARARGARGRADLGYAHGHRRHRWIASSAAQLHPAGSAEHGRPRSHRATGRSRPGRTRRPPRLRWRAHLTGGHARPAAACGHGQSCSRPMLSRARR